MDMSSLSAITAVLFVLTVCMFHGTSSKEEKKLLPCRGQQVCATVMRYKDGTIADEGDYCECKDGVCLKEWVGAELGDGASLSWQHYERAHWGVQYKFCRPVLQEKPECREGEPMGVEVQTAVSEWAPFVTMPRCVCPGGAPYRLQGWKRNGALWKYRYNCEMSNCTAPSEKQGESSVCARIYVDPGKKTDKVLEMRFQCACPEGHLCPAKYNDKEDNSNLLKDKDGRSYVIKECESVVKRKRST